MNVSKTKFMVFHTPRKRVQIPKLCIDGKPLECVETFVYLGITLHKNLSWNFHTEKIAQKVSKMNCVLSKLKRILPPRILKTIYNCLIACHLNYGVLLWGRSSNQLFKLQKRSVRLITASKYNAHTDPLFKSLQILKLEDIVKTQELVFFYKFVNGPLPSYFQTNYISYLNPNRESRNQRRLLFPRFRHEYFRQNLRYSIVNTVNNAPQNFIEKCTTH